MLQFPEEYFKTEVRDGFAISELMKRTWAAQLEVLNKVIGICDKYNLTYYAYWGTLLGTVRHQGYIPWDDDLDIAMKKDDYIRFLEVAQTELAGELCIHNCYTDPEYDEAFTRLTNGSSVDFADKRMISSLLAALSFSFSRLSSNSSSAHLSYIFSNSSSVKLLLIMYLPNSNAPNP